MKSHALPVLVCLCSATQLSASVPSATAAAPFDLSRVRLLDGPFKRAMERDIAYLLDLEPDRLLSAFRTDAGLAAKGEPYGGWEGQGVAGHSLGHYLSACALGWASSGNEALLERVNYIVDELAACQASNGDGYVGAIPEGKKAFADLKAGEVQAQPFQLNGIWVPWYTEHKVLAGLIDAYHLAENKQALEVAAALGRWVDTITGALSEQQVQTMLSCEHGGMNESLAELYAITDDDLFLTLSKRFHHRAVLDPLASGQDCLPGLHANTQVPKIIGAARRHELTGGAADRAIATFFWDRVVHHHSYVTGGHSDGEHFGPPDQLNDRISAHTCETCNIYNMLKLTKHLFCWTADADKADFHERALYNQILSSQNPDDGMMCYMVPVKPGHCKTYNTPYDSFWCCTGTGMENHVRYGESIYFKGEKALYVNLFIPSTLQWTEQGVGLRQETRFPEEDTVRLAVTAANPTPFSLRLRIPSWTAAPPSVSVNGKPLPATTEPGGYLAIDRTWHDGDTVQLTLPMALRLESMPDNPDRAAVLYGPIVLAGDLGPGELEDVRVPVLVTEDRDPAHWLEPVEGKPLHFRTTDIGKPGDVTLSPFYATHHRRYTVYWDFFTTEQWQAEEVRYAAEQERQRMLEKRTLDQVGIAEQQSEIDHALKSENSRTGDFRGRKWRDADNGWFSYNLSTRGRDLRTRGHDALSLLCTYWGSEAGDRTFDILVNGKKIATQTLHQDQPDAFFDKEYPIPPSLVKGKDAVTVRFESHPSNMAGGIFGLRLMRASEK